jgi:micrococcal nuclease
MKNFKFLLFLPFSVVLIGASCSNLNKANLTNSTNQNQTTSTETNGQKTKDKKQPKPTTTKEKVEEDIAKTLSTENKTAKKEVDRVDNKQKLAKNNGKQQVKKKAKKEAKEVSGCTNPEAKNYNPDATKSDGSCKYAQKTYEVTRVVDGDTIEINYNGSEEKVRLIGLDTTESKDPRKKVQCFSKEASSQMRQLVSGKEVKLEQGPMSDNRGYYGRLLRYVYLPNGTHVNAWMIKQGYGYSYTKYPHSKQSQFEQYEQQARENKRGLWADGVCEKEEVTTKDGSSTSYTCNRNKYNCSDFDTYSEAKEVYEACGGVENDVHRLDRDKDGTPCESLQ